MRVLLYTRHNATDWFRALASKLTVASATLIMSELRNEGDVSITDEFYRAYRELDIAERATARFGADACGDIIARCRLLRNLDRAQALRMIGAAVVASEAVIEQFRPDAFVAFRIDSYVLDVIDRLLRERRVPYVGLWRAAILPDMVFFTTRGEYVPVRDPADEEVDAFVERITAPDFKATSLARGARYDFPTFFKKYVQWNVRDLVVHAQGWLKRDRLGYRYLLTSRTLEEYRLRFANRRWVRYVDHQWERAFRETPLEKRIFIGLQVNPESTIDYYVRNLPLAQYEDVLFRIIDVLEGAGYRIFLKDHPNMFGRRSIGFIRKLAARPSVVLVPYPVSSNMLIRESAATFTWTGTIGLQASMAGKCPVVVDPTYLIPGAFIQIRTLDDLAELPARIRAFRPPRDLDALRRQTARFVLRAWVPGAMRFLEFKQDPRKEARGLELLAQTLNTYLPTFVQADAGAGKPWSTH